MIARPATGSKADKTIIIIQKLESKIIHEK